MVFWVFALVVAIGDAHAFGRRRAVPPPSLDLSIDQVQMAGSGCAQGSGVAQISQDRSSIRMSSPLSVAVESTRRLDRKACAAVITISKIPTGKRLVVSEVRLEGAQDLGAGAVGRVSHETFFAGESNPILEQELGSMEQESVSEILLTQTDAAATACGVSSALLRTNTALLLRNTSEARASHAELGVVELRLRLEDCAQE